MKKHPDEFPIVYALSPVPTLVPDAVTAQTQIKRIKAVLRRLERAVRRDAARNRKGGGA